MDKAPDSITTALAPSRKAFLQSIWQENWPKLNITSASKLHTSDIELAETLLSWLRDSNLDCPLSITISPPKSASASSASSSSSSTTSIPPSLTQTTKIEIVPTLPDDAFTHALAHIGVYRREETLPILKNIFYSLLPKGIAIVSVTKRNPIEEILQSVMQKGSSGHRRSSSSTTTTTTNPTAEGVTAVSEAENLRELAAAAQFELGKVRVVEREIVVTGEELSRLRGEVQGILDAACGQQGDAQSWERGFDVAWEREVERNGGALKVECWVLLAMKWDLLCA